MQIIILGKIHIFPFPTINSQENTLPPSNSFNLVSHNILSFFNLNKSWMGIFTCSLNASDWSLNPIDVKNWTTSSVVHLEASGYMPFSILGNVDRPFVVVSFLKKDLKIQGNIIVVHLQQCHLYQPRPTLPETALFRAIDEINDRGTNAPYYVLLSLISPVALKSKGFRHQCSKDNHRVPCNTN